MSDEDRKNQRDHSTTKKIYKIGECKYNCVNLKNKIY